MTQSSLHAQQHVLELNLFQTLSYSIEGTIRLDRGRQVGILITQNSGKQIVNRSDMKG